MSKNITAGEFDKNFKVDTNIDIRFAGNYVIIINDEIVAPDNMTDRRWKGTVKKGEKLEVITEARWTMKQEEVKFRGEIANPESMVEIVPEGELGMLERFKAEMMSQISQYAEDKGLDNFEEDNDLNWEDDDENLINTPYEYQEMKLEFPIDEIETTEKTTEELEITEPKIDENVPKSNTEVA